MVLEGGKVTRVSQERTKETSSAIGEMSINNGDDPVQASSDSFWEVGKYVRTVNRIDNGYKLCSSLKQLITSRADIERGYAKQLSQWSKKWNDFLDKGPEYGTTQGAWRGVLEESDKLADLHTEVADKLVNNVTVSIKQWQKENYHKSMMHFKETKELDDQFKKVQKPWEKKLNKVLTAKKDYHAACRNEKSTANQENNARADTAMSSDQLKKLQEKLKKCQIEVESTQEKYNACLNDLNGYNSKYIEDMTEVFEKCQSFEKQRIDFFKKIMFDIHQCLDLSVDSRYSQIYTTLHSTISNTDADKDLRWWSNNHGADMAMAWPIFEEYSPDLKPIHGKEKKSQITASEGGITITSIKHNPENFVPAASSNTTNNKQSNRSSTHSQQSHSSQHGGYNNTVAETGDTVNTNASRQDSYDESLNPFGDEEKIDCEGEKENANTNAENKSVHNAPAQAPSTSNPFGDGDSEDEHESQGSAPTQSSGGSVNVPARVLYDYHAEEEDELSAGAGDIITRISDQDDMGWVKAIGKDGKEGLIPFGYVEDC
ncbi:protein kinase C and casein kinase substrate in neurons protein 3-like isoform X3 [Ruditapes philippinarum]|uniref:protein kinase C and casein kinase substrate in neurons protein 3-like isoform X3 n=1 Tax=Ruditapes philippinarum TaxID=129788 RepID=UPI00295AA804|nr:protein kinase C and casein kinase substrate in neurons protein 3-like isoform X3 [Ruditapes philippinarum]